MISNLIGHRELLLTEVDKGPDSMMINTKYESKQSVNIHVVSLKCNGFSK